MDRRRAREIALEENAEFIEVFVDAPLEVCEARDPKGLYRRARAREIAGFTGIDAPYERPATPDLTLETGKESATESASRLLDFVSKRLGIRVT